MKRSRAAGSFERSTVPGHVALGTKIPAPQRKTEVSRDSAARDKPLTEPSASVPMASTEARAQSEGWQRFSGSSATNSRPTLDMNKPIVNERSYRGSGTESYGGANRGSASPTYRSAPSSPSYRGSPSTRPSYRSSPSAQPSYRSAPSPRSSGSSSYGGSSGGSRSYSGGGSSRGGGGSSRGGGGRWLARRRRTPLGFGNQSRGARPSAMEGRVSFFAENSVTLEECAMAFCLIEMT